MRISVNDFTNLSLEILMSYGLSQRDASIVTDELIQAEMRGRHSHGAVLLPRMIERLADRTGDIRIVQDGPATALVDGGNNLGQLVSHFSLELAIKKAKEVGVAAVGAYNKHTFVTAGYPARMAVQEHLIALIFASGMSPAVAPWGGAEAVLGTNPLAIGIPSINTPFILDMATSQVARADIRLAKDLGRPIPEGWALDKEGKPTTDPAKALEGTMLAIGGYKGSGLAMAIEILTGPLVNARAGSVIPGERGMLFIVVDPSRFVALDTFEEQASRLLEEVTNSKKAEGVVEILYPGQRAEQEYQKALKEGLDIPDKIYDQVLKLRRM